MPRFPRFVVDKGIYHICSRGHNAKEIFHDDRDFQKYKDLIRLAKKEYDFCLYHFDFLNNH